MDDRRTIKSESTKAARIRICASCSESARDTPRVWGQLPRRIWFVHAEAAFRMFTIVAVLSLVVVQREPTPD